MLYCLWGRILAKQGCSPQAFLFWTLGGSLHNLIFFRVSPYLMSSSDDQPFSILEHLGVENSERAVFLDKTGCQLNYSELHESLARLQEDILDSGLGYSARVVTSLPDHPTTAMLQLAMLGVCTLVPANPASSERELLELVESVGASAIISRSDDELVAAVAQKASLVWLGFDVLGSDSFKAVLKDLRDFRPKGGESCLSDVSERATALILPTSGSTGSPKLVPLRLEALCLSASNIADHLNLRDSDRALHILPMFHIGAVVDLLLAPLRRGGSICFAQGLPFSQLATYVQEQNISWIQMVPTMLNRLLAETGDESLEKLGAQLRFVRSVSSDLPPSMQLEIEEKLGGTPVIQIYGMTETCGQITSNPLPPAEGKPGSVGVPIGVELAIMDAFGNPLSTDEEGEVCVAGDTLTPGYENQENAKHFYGPWLRTGDLGRLDAEGYLFICGRLKEVVNRGGEKIALQEVDRIALTHPEVMEAASFATRHATLGEEVAIAVVLRRSVPDESGLQQYFADRLAEHKCPRQIYLIDELPRLGSGKIDRRSLAIQFGSSGKESHPLDYQPQSLNERLVSRLWSKILRAPAPVPGDDFFEVGGDSLAATGFLAALEKATKKTFPADLLYKSPSYEKLVQSIDEIASKSLNNEEAAHGLDLPKPIFDAIRQATASWPGRRRQESSLIIEHNTAGAKKSFFWCGNGREHFEDLIEALGANYPFFVLRTLSGQKLKSDANTNLLAEHYALEIEEIQPEGPISLGGFCQGAVLARRIAEQLAARGREIKLVVFVDRVFHQPFLHPTLLVWSSSSQYSARTNYREPERGLPYLFPKGFAVHWHSSQHRGSVFGEGAVELAEQIEGYLGGQSVITQGHGENSASFVERCQLHKAVVAGRFPRVVKAGEEFSLTLRVTNLSDKDWPADNSILVAARWFNLDGHIRTVRAGEALLQQGLKSGETREMELAVEAPAKRLPYVLMVDAVDDGIGWFYQLGNSRIKSQFVFVR